MWLSLVIGVLTAYLLGNLNGAVCVSALMHEDVRSRGSGNAGLTNFIRNFGTGSALYVILVDGAKAVLACLVCGLLLKPYGYFLDGVMAGGTAVMLGHVYPALLGFRGGKGILSGLFIALVADWRVALLILAIFAVVYLLSGYVSLGSILAAIGFAVGFCVFHSEDVFVMAGGIFMGALTIFMHRSNIGRLIAGKESKTSLFHKEKNQ